MLVAGFPAAFLDTNCWVVAPRAGARCVVIDPGAGVAEPLRAVLAEHDLTPVAVLLTHGHVDHTFSAAELCARYRVPTYLHPADRPQLADPASGLGMPAGTPIFGRSGFAEPDDVRALTDGPLALAGLAITARSAPGHTPGSVIFELDDPDGVVWFSGDFLFAGSVGRADLPGGDAWAMQQSLRTLVLPADPRTRVHPGHGDSTTVAAEMDANPYLREAAAGSAP